jgi:hypothetical protein
VHNATEAALRRATHREKLKMFFAGDISMGALRATTTARHLADYMSKLGGKSPLGVILL